MLSIRLYCLWLWFLIVIWKIKKLTENTLATSCSYLPVWIFAYSAHMCPCGFFVGWRARIIKVLGRSATALPKSCPWAQAGPPLLRCLGRILGSKVVHVGSQSRPRGRPGLPKSVPNGEETVPGGGSAYQAPAIITRVQISKKSKNNVPFSWDC